MVIIIIIIIIIIIRVVICCTSPDNTRMGVNNIRITNEAQQQALSQHVN